MMWVSVMTKDEFDDREDLYEHLLKEVTALCECGSSAADIIVHALIRNAVELAVVCTENTAEARRRLRSCGQAGAQWWSCNSFQKKIIARSAKR
jgi:hypothetical protein